MRALAALALGGAVFLWLRPQGRPPLVDRVGSYLRALPARRPALQADPAAPLRRAGLDWTVAELRARRLVAVSAGALLGALLAQGDLFVTGVTRSRPGLMATGGLAGLLALRMWITSRQEQRAARLHQELPTLADTLALMVVAGESIASALERFVERARGVAVEEITAALDDYRQGAALGEVMARAARDTAHPEAARLYHLLAHAHLTGGRLADSLSELASDYRAALARRLTAEGGRRALAAYGPILALMIPTTLVFLMYPTLVALRLLAGEP